MEENSVKLLPIMISCIIMLLHQEEIEKFNN